MASGRWYFQSEGKRHDHWPISTVLNVVGKIFFVVVARRFVSYLKTDSLIDTSVQKAGIPGFSGCLEHTSMLHQIQAMKAIIRVVGGERLPPIGSYTDNTTKVTTTD